MKTHEGAMLELDFSDCGAPYSTLYIDKVGQRIGLDTPNGVAWLVVTGDVLFSLIKFAIAESTDNDAA